MDKTQRYISGVNPFNHMDMTVKKTTNPSKPRASIVTVLLDRDDLNRNLAQQILDDCERSGVPSSYRTTLSEILNRPDVVPDLLDEDGCLVVPLLGVASTSVPATAKTPNAVIVRNRSGEGTAYLKLRGGNILVATQELCKSQLTSRYLVLYLFDDCLALDMIRATKALEEDMCVHATCAQSFCPVDDDAPPEPNNNAFQLPIVASRMRTVTRREDTPEGDMPQMPRAEPDTPKQMEDTQWLDEIPF